MTMRVSDCIRMALSGLVRLWLTEPSNTGLPSLDDLNLPPSETTFFLYHEPRSAIPTGKRVRVQFVVEDYPPATDPRE